MSYTEKKLLIYFLVECSNAMSGKLIEKARAWIKYYLEEYRTDPDALKSARLSIITFDRSARQIVPPTKLMDFQVPRLQTDGNSAVLGEALHVLQECINRDVGYGGWKPIVYLFCKSIPTDKERFFHELGDIRAFTDEQHIFACYDGCIELAYILDNITSNLIFMDSEIPVVSYYPEKCFGFPWETCPIDSPLWPIYIGNGRNFEHRSPIYFLIDCSNSMSGKPIDTVKQGIQDFVSYLKGTPQALETVYLSVITFSSSARQVTPLTELLTFRMPQLQIGGSANLEEAFRVLKDCIQRNERADNRKPCVFLFTIGSLTNQRIFARKVNEFQTSAGMAAFATETFETSEMISYLAYRALDLDTIGVFGTYIGKFHFGNINESLDKSDTEVNLSVSLNKNSNNKGEVIMESYGRRLPVYLLLDCSGSMHGEPIEAVRQGINTLLSDLQDNPQALETAYLSVITFDSSAQQVVPLTELMAFNPPELHASGLTSLGGALRVLKDCIKRELIPNTEGQKGDWRPLVFLLTDGCPTDGEVLHKELQDLSALHAANIIACAAGPEADTTTLKQITPNVLLMNSTSAGDMAAFFAWVTSSMSNSVKNVTENPGEPFTIQPPPKNLGFTVVP